MFFRRGCAARLDRAEYVVCVKRGQMRDQRRELFLVESMHGRGRRVELQAVCRARHDMQVAPVDRFASRVPRQPTQPEPTKERRRTDVDCDEPEHSVALGELDVGHAPNAPACDVDDLRVEHVAVEEQRVGVPRVSLAGSHPRAWLERLDECPRIPPAADEQVRHDGILLG